MAQIPTVQIFLREGLKVISKYLNTFSDEIIGNYTSVIQNVTKMSIPKEHTVFLTL